MLEIQILIQKIKTACKLLINRILQQVRSRYGLSENPHNGSVTVKNSAGSHISDFSRQNTGPSIMNLTEPEQSHFSEPEKRQVRSEALSHAVNILTKKRSDVAIVPSNYVDKVRAHILRNPGIYDSRIARSCTDGQIHLWEKLWSASISSKQPGDLTVAYLGGPDPLNDFRELTRLGVHPHNIWAFESENRTYSDAISKVKNSEFPLLKIHNGTIDSFFQSVPRRFDIIYLDACGPLPSVTQGTLRMIADVFRYHRLSSPGVLITNFAKPDITDPGQREAYSDLVSCYLYPKCFLESGDAEWNLTDGVIAHGFLCKHYDAEDDISEKLFFDEVGSKFDHYYGQYLTRQIFDLASLIAPWGRLTNAKDLWNILFTIGPSDAAQKALRLLDLDDAFKDEYLFTDPGDCPLAWTAAVLENARRTTPNTYLPTLSAGSRKLFEKWSSHLGGHPKLSCDAQTAIKAYLALRHGSFTQPFLSSIMGSQKNFEKMYQFCDVPTGELVFFPILAQYSVPMHPNIAETRQYSYIASGKKTRMFLDVIPFDECRYIYDWLPLTELIPDSLEMLTQQLVYRFALDGLAKHCIRYNDEYLFAVHVVGVNHEGFSEKILSPRINL